MPRRTAVHRGPAATGWAPEAHALLEIRCVGRVQRAAVSEALGDARRCDRGPRAYRSHHRLVAALDALVLVVLTVVTTWATYRFAMLTGPFRQPQPVQLMKSLAVIAGLLFYFASGPGGWSRTSLR